MKSAATNKQAKILPTADVKTVAPQIESQLYHVYELQTELQRGKEEYEKILPQYQAVIDALTAHNKPEDFPEGTIEQFKKDKEDIQKGLENINYRLSMIKMLFDKADDSEEAKSIVDWFTTVIFQILGMGLPNQSSAE